MGWNCHILPSANIINTFSTVAFSNVIPSLTTIYEKKDLNIALMITLIVW